MCLYSCTIAGASDIIHVMLSVRLEEFVVDLPRKHGVAPQRQVLHSRCLECNDSVFLPNSSSSLISWPPSTNRRLYVRLSWTLWLLLFVICLMTQGYTVVNAGRLKIWDAETYYWISPSVSSKFVHLWPGCDLCHQPLAYGNLYQLLAYVLPTCRNRLNQFKWLHFFKFAVDSKRIVVTFCALPPQVDPVARAGKFNVRLSFDPGCGTGWHTLQFHTIASRPLHRTGWQIAIRIYINM